MYFPPDTATYTKSYKIPVKRTTTEKRRRKSSGFTGLIYVLVSAVSIVLIFRIFVSRVRIAV